MTLAASSRGLAMATVAATTAGSSLWAGITNEIFVAAAMAGP